MNGQLSFAPNGNITPCPWKDVCLNHPAGCKGYSYWCKRFDKEKDRKQLIKALKKWRKLHG